MAALIAFAGLLALTPASAEVLAPYKDRLFRYKKITESLYDGDFIVVEYSKQRDLRDRDEVARTIRETAPDLVINLAALTDVDLCEREPERAERVNCSLVRNIADNLTDDTLLVQLSTDQVYSDTAGPHGETDPQEPVNRYGQSKLAGEAAALTHGNTLVLRVNFFGPSRTAGRASLSDVLSAGVRDKKPMVFFEDSYFSPLHIQTLADMILRCTDQGLTGIFNLGCRDGASKADFAEALCAHLNLSTETARRGRSTEMPGRARRPADLRMNVDKLENALGCRMPSMVTEIEKL